VKIALVVPGGVDRSGEIRVIPALLALIARLAGNHSVHVYALHQEPRPASWALAGAHIHNIGVGRVRVRALRALYAEHRRSRFHLVHSIWSGDCGQIAVAAGRILRVPSLVHVAGGEVVRLPDIGYGGRLRWRGRLAEALVLGGATAVTAASAPLIQTLAQLGVAAERVPLGVDPRSWPPQLPVRRTVGEPARLVHVGSLNRVKDQPTLLRALVVLEESSIPFHMDVVGDDTLGGEVQGLAHSLGLADRVRFHGFLRQQELLPVVRAAHAMVISSRHEAGPVAMLEAGVLGVPTVGTAVGHVAEWAPHGAISVPVGDSAKLAAALLALLTDEDLRLRIAHEAFKRATREDADYTARRVESLYAELLTRRR
jgi:glycosyltransferase involved in cell wall biosynthesis